MAEHHAALTIPPNLGNVITAADVDQKGSGSYAADYVNWCRTAQLLREHAPGWQFHLRPAADSQHVWRAPNGTGYVVGFFEGPDGTVTPDFPQAVMDNRNAAISMEKIGARDLTDTHRRCLCTAAAATFGLAWQLWAKEPLENPHREEPRAQTRATSAQPKDERAIAAATARKALAAAGLTREGAQAMLQELAPPGITRLDDLPLAILKRLGHQGASDAEISRWNSAHEPAADTNQDQGEEFDPEDPPIHWEQPTVAGAA